MFLTIGFVVLLMANCTFSVELIDVARIAAALAKKAEDSDDKEVGVDRFIPQWTRLAFHDCPTKCDGCIDFDLDAHAGLQRVIEVLFDFWQSGTFVTGGANAILPAFSDFVALAGVVGTVVGSRRSPNDVNDGRLPKINYRTGRVDCVTQNPPDAGDAGRNLPNADWSFTQVMNYFLVEFAFNQNEVTALLGAHTLGRCSTNQSGYHGPWDNHPNRLDNDYYDVLLEASDDEWKQRQLSNTGKWQWNEDAPQNNPGPLDEGEEMMLNVDISLTRLLDPNANGEEQNCQNNVADCAKSPTFNLVKDFEDDNDLWISKFQAVFGRMIENGYTSLDTLTGNSCSAPSGSSTAVIQWIEYFKATTGVC